MNRLTQLFTRRRRYDELSETIREHLAEKIADLMDRGMSLEEAERTARREFGNVTLIEQRSREVWSWPTLERRALSLDHYPMHRNFMNSAEIFSKLTFLFRRTFVEHERSSPGGFMPCGTVRHCSSFSSLRFFWKRTASFGPQTASIRPIPRSQGA
jgi:hypothetical protein